MAKKASGGARTSTWVALFRAINVGGNNIVPMAELRNGLAESGLENVRSYIQSGNVVFESSWAEKSVLKSIEECVEQRFGFSPKVMLFKADQLRKIVGENPFAKCEEDSNQLHCFLWDKKPKKPDLEQMAELKAGSEAFAMTSGGCYVHAPDGVARSKLFAKMEKLLGVPVTGRNFKSLNKILKLAEKK